MTRILIYLFPAVMDVMLGAVFFVSQSRLADAGKPVIYTTSVIAVWAFVYMLVAQLAGKLTTPRNASVLVISGSAVCALCSVAYLVFTQITALYVIIAFVGIGCAFFFTPFQIFMKTVDSDRPRGVAFSVGLYTFSWSTGLALGPFISGYIMDNFTWKWQCCHIMNFCLAVLAGTGILFLRHHAGNRHAPPVVDRGVKSGTNTGIDYSKFPDLAWLGWVAAGIGCLTVACFRSYYPPLATIYKITKSDQGMTIAIAGCVQGLTGLVMCRSRLWMYRAMPVVLFGVSGIAGMICLAFARTNLLFNIGAVLYGVYCGSFFFYLVFHSLVHPEKSARYIAINESVVGATSVAGPLMAGYLAFSSLSLPFLFFAFMTLLAILLQIYYHGVKYKVDISQEQSF